MKRLQMMVSGGKKLGEIRAALHSYLDVFKTPNEIELLAQKLIKKTGGKPSFSMVPGYKWATCVNINEGVVHGIPQSDIPFADGDLVMVDVGLYYKGFHTDCAFTKIVGTKTQEKLRFLKAGKLGLKAALDQIKPGAKTGELSQAMQTTLESYGYTPAIELTGHGIGKLLHTEPSIPCLLKGKIKNTKTLQNNQTLAVEIIYVQGSPALKVEKDGWTIKTMDGKISAVFEETVAVTNDGYSILTQPTLFQRS